MSKIIELSENYYIIKDDNFSCVLDDDKRVKLGLMCEIFDVRDMGSEYDGELYPYVIECSIVPLEYGKKFRADIRKSACVKASEMNELDAYMYAGGVSVNMSGIKGEDKTDADFEMRSQKHATFGNEIKVPHFRTDNDAIKYIKDVYSKNVSALMGLIGFYLDKPVNRVGWSGWDIISHQVLDTKLEF